MSTQRFWVSWWSGNYADEGCTKPPFKFWVSGQRDRQDYGLSEDQYLHYTQIEDEDDADDFLDTHSRDDCSICAVIDADDEDAVWTLVAIHFPDYESRFCEPKPSDWSPGDRFQ